MQIKLTGDLGFNTDAERGLQRHRHQAAAWRRCCSSSCCSARSTASVLVALTPLIVVFFAYTIAQGFIYLLAKSGATVSSNSTSILIVLMFGVGTDYCLLLVSRLREELRRTEDKHAAMQQALSRSGPGDPRQRADRDPGDAGPRLRRLAQHLDPRPGGRDRGRQRPARRPHPAAGAADDLRPPRVLAAPTHGRLRPRARRRAEAGRLAAVRRQGALQRPGPALLVDGRRLRRPGRSACSRSRSTTRPRPSSRSRSRASRASSCSRTRSRPACSRR